MTTTAATPSNLPRAGGVLRITRSASVQFRIPFYFRVIRTLDWQTTDGWAWIDGYQLDSSGDAVERRQLYVQLRGLQGVNPTHFPAPASWPAAPVRKRARQSAR